MLQTSGLVDLFERTHLAENILAWASIRRGRPKDATSAVNYLVLAVGSQSVDEGSSAQYFQYAKALALSSLGGDTGTETVQAFALITLYMLRACQINGAFLFFGKLCIVLWAITTTNTDKELLRERHTLLACIEQKSTLGSDPSYTSEGKVQAKIPIC